MLRVGDERKMVNFFRVKKQQERARASQISLRAGSLFKIHGGDF